MATRSDSASGLQRARSLIVAFHALVARSRLASRAYLAFWSVALRLMPRGQTWTRCYSFLSIAPWPIERFGPRTCSLIGSSGTLKLVPHTGLIDFQALFTRDFDYEVEVLRFLDTHLAEIDTVVEIGANVGLHTLHFSRRFADRGHGTVFAFEPAPRTFRALLDNLLANDVRNVTPLNAAVFTHSGLATFYEPTVAAHGDRALTRSSLVEGHAKWEAREVREYPVFTLGPDHLDVVFRDRGRVLIKLDIEGAEAHVLKAMEPLLRRYRPEIVMEVLHNATEPLNQLGFLRELYQLFHLTDEGPVEHPQFIGDPDFAFKDYFLAPRWH